HEATHAAHDIRGDDLDRIAAEAVAVLAEAWFLQVKTSRPKAGLSGDAQTTYEIAHKLVTFMRKGKDYRGGKLDIDGKTESYSVLMDRFFTRIRSIYGTGTYTFDGI